MLQSQPAYDAIETSSVGLDLSFTSSSSESSLELDPIPLTSTILNDWPDASTKETLAPLGAESAYQPPAFWDFLPQPEELDFSYFDSARPL